MLLAFLKLGSVSKVFSKHGVPISMKEARLPMGLRKDLHIKEITKIPEVKKRWIDKYNDTGRDDTKV